MLTLQELTQYTNTFLHIQKFKDYCPNGLQVEGKQQVNKIVAGVTACQALLEIACEKEADAILVHHGYFWGNEDSCVVGMKRQRLKLLLEHEISLLAYHLPLDAHPEVGNNVQLAKVLGLEVDGILQSKSLENCGSFGHVLKPITAGEFKNTIETALGRKCTHIPAATSSISTVGWCTGAGQGFIQLAVNNNLDAYISGEISEPTAHIAREMGIHYFAAGHHATERYGVQALGEHLAQQFSLNYEFIDIDNPA